MEEIKKEHIDEGKSIAWLSYLGILLLVPLLVQKDNPYTKFHVKQGLALLIAWIVLYIVGLILSFIPILGLLILLVAWIFPIVLAIMGIINSVQGKMQKLPLIGDFGEKFTF